MSTQIIKGTLSATVAGLQKRKLKNYIRHITPKLDQLVCGFELQYVKRRQFWAVNLSIQFSRD
jgi:hypothetical protein